MFIQKDFFKESMSVQNTPLRKTEQSNIKSNQRAHTYPLKVVCPHFNNTNTLGMRNHIDRVYTLRYKWDILLFIQKDFYKESMSV